MASRKNQNAENLKPHNWPLFLNLDETACADLDRSIKILNYGKDEVVFRPEDRADGMYYMVSGRMKISKLMPDGRAQIFYIYNPGDFVGGLNVLSGDHYLYLGETLEKSIIGYVPKDIFDKYVINRLDSLKIILSKSYDRIRWAEDLISRLSSSNAEIKVAGLLISLIDPYGKQVNGEIQLKLSITREEMGSYAGLTRETMTRKLNDFKNRGLIDFIGNHTIVIKNLEGLRSIIYLVD